MQTFANNDKNNVFTLCLLYFLSIQPFTKTHPKNLNYLRILF